MSVHKKDAPRERTHLELMLERHVPTAMSPGSQPKPGKHKGVALRFGGFATQLYRIGEGRESEGVVEQTAIEGFEMLTGFVGAQIGVDGVGVAVAVQVGA